MKPLKEIFARIWALWGIITFIVTFLVVFIPSMFTYLFPGKKGQYAFIIISRIWMRSWLFLVACPL
ncbi:MAG TPA: 1-acyl-sn-glycerol-3-phosphate acyltransferase, partial [Chitinophagaceae bacterium]